MSSILVKNKIKDLFPVFLPNCFSKPLSSDWGPSVADTHWRHKGYRNFCQGWNEGNMENLSVVFFQLCRTNGPTSALEQWGHIQGHIV